MRLPPTHALPVYNGTPAPQLMLGHKGLHNQKIRARKLPRNSAASSTILDHRESCDKFKVLTTLYETPLLKIALAGFVNSQWNFGFTSRLCISKNKSHFADTNRTPCRPQLQALDRNVPHRTRTASTGSECFSQPDLDHKESCEDIADRMPEKNVRRYARTYAKTYGRKNVRLQCQRKSQY